MKKLICYIVMIYMSLSVLAGCSGDFEEAESVELVVFAAASMTETMILLGEQYMDEHPEIKIVFNFDSSGTLKTQIQEGADCDLFISAGQKQMDQLDKNADASVNADCLDFVLEGTRCDLLENQVVLAVPDGNPAEIRSYETMMESLKEGKILLAVGNTDVPVGQYTEQIFEYFGWKDEEILSTGSVTYGSNVKEVTAQVLEAVADCAIVYRTDAHSTDLTVVDTATEKMCGRIIYPAAVMKNSSNAEAAQAFLDFIRNDAGDEVFSAVGFAPIS